VAWTGCGSSGTLPSSDFTPEEAPEETPEPTPDAGPCDPTDDGTFVAGPGFCARDACATIDGSLTIDASLDTSEDISCIVSVTGDLVIEGWGAEALDLPVLDEVGGDLVIRSNYFDRLAAFPSLRRVGGSMTISETNAELTGRFQALTSVRALEVLVLGGAANFPVLETAERVEILGSDLAAVDLPALRRVGVLSLAWADGMTVLGDIGALETVDEIFFEGLSSLESLGGLVVPPDVPTRVALTEHPVLSDITALAGLRRVGTLLLRNNFGLADVTPLYGIESLSGDLIIEDNTALGTAGAEALRDAIGVENIAGFVVIDGNDGD
jgi:hypothetical protein